MSIRNLLLATCLLLLPHIGAGAEKEFPTFNALTLGGYTYSNVTITEVTATDLYFKHSRGVGNAKLKKLDPELQKKFAFDPQKAAEIEQQQKRGNELARLPVKPKVMAPVPNSKPGAGQSDSNVDIVVPELNAKSFLHKPAPTFVVEKWISTEPNLRGKFILLDFWATWCGPCIKSIPHLNQLQSKFKDRLIVVGVSGELEADVRAMKAPVISYSSAIDSQNRMSQEFEVEAIPHSVLIDPKGVVRFEGMPDYLQEQGLEKILQRYRD